MKQCRLPLFLLACTLVLLLSTLPVQEAASANDTTPVYLPYLLSPFSTGTSTNLRVESATYLGGAGADTANAVDIAPDGSIVLGGTLPGNNPGGVVPVTLLGGGDGVVLRMSPDAQSVRSLTRIGTIVNDLEVGDDGHILVCGSFGIALLAADGGSIVWNDATPGTVTHCARGTDGTAAAVAGSVIQSYTAAGAPLGTWNPGANPADVAVDGVNSMVIATGWTQASGNLQVPWLKGWSTDGTTLRWTGYDFAASAVSGQGLGADSRGLLVAIGRDGLLYFAGRTDGGNTVFGRDPQNVAAALPGDILVKTDRFNDPFQLSGSINFGFYGRFDPETGALLNGQFILTRLNNGNGNSIQAHGLMADESGRLYISGQAYATIERRSERQIAGIAVGPYSGGEPFLLIVAPDFSRRIIWTTFAGSGGAGGSPAFGVSVRDGRAAMVVGLSASASNLITINALQPARGGGAEVYLAVWPQGAE